MSAESAKTAGTPGEVLERRGVPYLDGEAIEEWPKGTDEPVFVAFIAPWCEVCLEAAPLLVELATEFDDRGKFRRLDVDASAVAAERVRVGSVPSLVLYARGREIDRLVGLANLEDLREFAEKALEDVPPAEKQNGTSASEAACSAEAAASAE